jgi:hypothetical protein
LNLISNEVQSIESTLLDLPLSSRYDFLHGIHHISQAITLAPVWVKGHADPGYQVAFIDRNGIWCQVRIVITGLMFIKIMG